MNTAAEAAPITAENDRDFQLAPMPVKLTKQELLSLSRINPWLSLYHIAGEWLLIVLAVICCQHSHSWIVYLAAVVFIGARQHALLILMHDGTHYRLVRNRPLNDWLTELLLAWPHLVTMRAYRHNHLAHHNNVNSDNDPDWLRKKDNPEWHFPQSPFSLLLVLLRDLSGLGAIKLLRLAGQLAAGDSRPSKSYTRIRLAFYVVAIGTIIALGGAKLVLLYWLIPYFTWLVFIMRIRSIAEHFAIKGEPGPFGQTRTTRTGVLARIFIAPKNVNYHIEHHLFPSVPFYRLPRLHELLMRKEGFADVAHITGSYARVLGECVRRRGALQELRIIVRTMGERPGAAF